MAQPPQREREALSAAQWAHAPVGSSTTAAGASHAAGT